MRSDERANLDLLMEIFKVLENTRIVLNCVQLSKVFLYIMQICMWGL